MQKKIKSALISVFYKDGLDDLLKLLHEQQVTLYSTGGTQKHIESIGLPCVPVEDITGYPSILDGRVKTLHPKIFGGILAKRDSEVHNADMQAHHIPEIDLVIVDLYPFEETVANTSEASAIIEKIDIGGPSMIRAAAKNHSDLVVIASKNDYATLHHILQSQQGSTTLEQRHAFATKAFQIVAQYDIAIAQWFLQRSYLTQDIQAIVGEQFQLRYGENPHQQAVFYGNLDTLFTQLHGKALSYNNMVDVDAALQLIAEFSEPTFAIIKHTNTCGVASRENLLHAWHAALAGDPESAFGGVLVCNGSVDEQVATAINDIFFEVLIAKDFAPSAMAILQQKKNRILLQVKSGVALTPASSKTILNGLLQQAADEGNIDKWTEVGARECTEIEKEDLLFANLVCKHLKSNAIAIVKNKQLIGKGCGQTSRVDALKFAIEKAKHFGFELNGAALASDAFFPFDDCIRLAYEVGITAIIQPGGSVRDGDSISFAQANNMAMVMTGLRHFKH